MSGHGLWFHSWNEAWHVLDEENVGNTTRAAFVLNEVSVCDSFWLLFGQ